MAEAQQTTALVRYETDSGEVALSPILIKQYLVNGQGNVTDQEIMMFLRLCQYQRLNPFLREAYLIKFGSQAATIVTGKDVFTKRAAKDPQCAGWEAGVMVETAKGGHSERPGAMVLPGETLLGGWAKVHRHGWTVPLANSVSLSEYVRTTADGKPNRNWASMPATMIRKVALVQALREAFPESFQGLYSAEEMPVDSAALPSQPVQQPEAQAQAAETKAASPNDKATDAQRRTLMELAKQLKVDASEMTQLITNRYGKSSSMMLTVAEADDLERLLLGTVREMGQAAEATETTGANGSLFGGDPR